MKSSLMNLSHSKKLSCKMGQLLPVGLFDVVPGDKIDHRMTALLRTQPLLAPLMHAVDIDFHVYFAPDRLVWDDSEDFHTGGDDGMDTTVAPYMDSPVGGYLKGSLADYLGLPLGVAGLRHSALPFRHYANIWNWYYRDEQLQSKVVVSTASGADVTTSTALLNVCWKRDYFTKARPEPQLGPDVTIPLFGSAPVVSDGNPIQVHTDTETGIMGTSAVAQPWFCRQAGNWTAALKNGFYGDANGENTGLEADLSSVAAVDIRDLREASAWQRFLEFNNNWGARYWEQIRARFGVPVQDYRLQMPEFLGSGSAKFQFSEVLQTAEGSDPVGELRGHGISIVGSNRYRRRIPEHGWVFVFMVVRPKTQYMQGLHRSWSRETKFDYLLPEFEAIGDQAVAKKEVYAGAAAPDSVFGYTPRYEEYRTIPSTVSGDFRDTLKYWHMARDFASEPSLNATFVGCNPTTRVFPDTTSDNMYITVQHDILARRKLSREAKYRLM